MPSWLTELDHTADTGIIVQAHSKQELFERAALGMFTVLTNIESVQHSESRKIVVESEDIESLMLVWLSRLNFLHITERLLFSKFEIELLSDTRCQAVAIGEQIDESRHEIFTEIKAVTFHGLKVFEKADKWRAQIIFDL